MRSCLAWFVLGLSLLGCSAGGGADASRGVGGGSATGGRSGSVSLPGGVDPAALIPARIRRLTNLEYDATVQALLGTSLTPSKAFAPDARQSGYTLNDAQRIDAVTARQIFAAAGELALEVKTKHLGELAPCSKPQAEAEAEACATRFIQSFGRRAYRRPLTAEETSGLMTVYRAGALDANYADGIEQVVRATLQSAGLLYLTEIGENAPARDGSVSLAPHELASSLSYLVTGGPPDAELEAALASGALFKPEGRVEQVRRLFGTGNRSAGRDRMVRFVREWFGVDRIELIDKDANVYEKYHDLKTEIEKETHDFVSSVLMRTGTVGELLSAESVASAKLGEFYRAEGAPTRRGILNQAAFLATYAHATESAPVLRGVAVARRVACLDVRPPTDLGLVVTTPDPDPTQTTRERFTRHSSDALCAGCHSTIDPFGFSFELFDGMGEYRKHDGRVPRGDGTYELKAVNSAVTVALRIADLDGDYPDSNALALALSESATVRECLARQMFRASAGRSDPTVSASEAAFVESWKKLPESEQGNLLSTLIEFVKSPLFTHRRAR